MGATVLPALVPVQPKVIQTTLTFDWNYEDVKSYLTACTERYKKLVVTDENVEDMGKAYREVRSLRTAITAFKTKANRKLKEPTIVLGKQIDELLDIVADVENPLNEQLEVYENQRLAKISEQISHEIEVKAKAAGLKDGYLERFMQSSKWTNKTARWSDTVVDIDHEITRLVGIQKLDDERIQLIAERREMANGYIAMVNEKYHLKTPIKMNDVFAEQALSEYTITELKKAIYDKAEELHEIEQQAIQVAEEEQKQKEERALVEAQRQAELQSQKQVEQKIAEMEEQKIGEQVIGEEIPQEPQTTGRKTMIITIHNVDIASGEDTLICQMIDGFDHPYDVKLEDGDTQ